MSEPKLPKPFIISEFVEMARTIAEKEEHQPTVFLFADGKDEADGISKVVSLGLSGLDKEKWRRAISEIAAEHNATHMLMIAESWCKITSPGEKLPDGPVRHMEGRIDALMVNYEGPSCRCTWMAEIKNADAETDRGVGPFSMSTVGMSGGEIARILPSHDISKN